MPELCEGLGRERGLYIHVGEKNRYKLEWEDWWRMECK